MLSLNSIEKENSVYLNTVDIDEFITNYPFLNQIPADVLRGIDLNVLHIPLHHEKNLLRYLKDAIGKNIALYRKNYTPLKKHLCKTIRYATLSESQLSLLLSFERRLNKVIVAYEQPVQLYSTDE